MFMLMAPHRRDMLAGRHNQARIGLMIRAGNAAAELVYLIGWSFVDVHAVAVLAYRHAVGYHLIADLAPTRPRLEWIAGIHETLLYLVIGFALGFNVVRDVNGIADYSRFMAGDDSDLGATAIVAGHEEQQRD